MFYFNKTRRSLATYCKSCEKSMHNERRLLFKAKCVSYKGGKCELCGYNKYLSALEFHHLDPSKKDFAISKHHSNKFTDELKNELDKCQLLCANCHSDIHSHY